MMSEVPPLWHTENAINLCRQVSFEPHKSVEPKMLVNQPCPFKCSTSDGRPGKIILRYHCNNWAHIRCANLQCIYRPFSVKDPVDLKSILAAPINSTPSNLEMYANKMKAFENMVEFEKKIVDPNDFAAALARESLNVQHQPHEELSFQELVPVGGTRDDTALAQQIYFLRETASHNAKKKVSYVDEDSDGDSDTPKRKRGRKKKDDPSSPTPKVKSYYVPNGRKPGRPKGYSPVKARQEAERAKQLELGKCTENLVADSTSGVSRNSEAFNTKIVAQAEEVIHFGRNCTDQRVQYYSHKPVRPRSSGAIRAIERILFSHSKGISRSNAEKARMHLLKALMFACQVPSKKVAKEVRLALPTTKVTSNDSESGKNVSKTMELVSFSAKKNQNHMTSKNKQCHADPMPDQAQEKEVRVKSMKTDLVKVSNKTHTKQTNSAVESTSKAVDLSTNMPEKTYSKKPSVDHGFVDKFADVKLSREIVDNHKKALVVLKKIDFGVEKPNFRKSKNIIAPAKFVPKQPIRSCEDINKDHQKGSNKLVGAIKKSTEQNLQSTPSIFDDLPEQWVICDSDNSEDKVIKLLEFESEDSEDASFEKNDHSPDPKSIMKKSSSPEKGKELEKKKVRFASDAALTNIKIIQPRAEIVTPSTPIRRVLRPRKSLG